MRAPTSIIAIASVLLIGSVLMLGGSFYLSFANPAFVYLLPAMIIQIAFCLLGIVTAVGLLLLREPARKAAIFLSTVPLFLVVFASLVLLGASRSTHNPLIAVAFLIFAALFSILLPISIWWLVLLRRDDVRSHFR